MRPELKKDLNVKDFRDFYWLKEELQTFCRDSGMSASGSKIEIADRIAIFLETGENTKADEEKEFFPKRNKIGRIKFRYCYYRKPSL